MNKAAGAPITKDTACHPGAHVWVWTGASYELDNPPAPSLPVGHCLCGLAYSDGKTIHNVVAVGSE